MATAPPKPAPPPPPKRPTAASPAHVPTNDGEPVFSSGALTGIGNKTVFYGTGGIGKSQLVENARQVGFTPLILDLDGSTKFLDVARYDLTSWAMLRRILKDKARLAAYDMIAVDDFTKAEEMAAAFVCANKRTKDGNFVTTIADFKYDGDAYLFDEFLLLLADLDAVAREGKQVVCMAHDATAKVPNPEGSDWIRYEPRLSPGRDGRNSIRAKVKEWSDHLLYIGYDVAAASGKATGGGSRCIYPVERPTCLAKSRSLSEPIVYERGSPEVWKRLFNLGDVNNES